MNLLQLFYARQKRDRGGSLVTAAVKIWSPPLSLEDSLTPDVLKYSVATKCELHVCKLGQGQLCQVDCPFTAFSCAISIEDDVDVKGGSTYKAAFLIGLHQKSRRILTKRFNICWTITLMNHVFHVGHHRVC